MVGREAEVGPAVAEEAEVSEASVEAALEEVEQAEAGSSSKSKIKFLNIIPV